MMDRQRVFLASAAMIVLGGCLSATPRMLPPNEVARQIRELPKNARFSTSGLGFWNGKLYAASNIGLLEIEEQRLSAFYQWHSSYNVIEGPWREESGPALWFWDCSFNQLLRWGPKGWTRRGLPPREGGYSRGNILGGFRACWNSERTWIVGAGDAWHWDPAESEWIPEQLPRGGVTGLAPVEKGLIAVMLFSRSMGDGGWTSEVEFSISDGTRWVRINAPPSMGLARQVVGTTEAGYLRTRDGDVIRVDRGGVRRVAQPAPCDALTRTSDGELLASFVGKGIYQYDAGEWRLRCPTPYGPEEGEHWAFLAEEKGRIAFATTEYETVVDWEKGTRSWSGTSAIWVLKDKALERVRLGVE